jgi:hypothetical protein
MELVGLAELAELFGMSKRATIARTREEDFPEPAACLRATPVWRREDLIRYARMRCARYHEREALQRLADEALPPVRYSELVAATRETR